MGIKLGQPMGVINHSLQQKGFYKKNNYGSKSLFIYSGEFWKLKEATLYVFTQNGLVTSIDVISTPKYYPVTTYNDLIKSLSNKYGKYNIRKGNYYIWIVEGGAIEVSYDKKEIHIFYMDTTNTGYIRKYQKRNVNDDL